MKIRSNWKWFILEFLSVFVAVILAFTLTRWNEDRRDALSKDKILTEIKNGLKLDLSDLQGNMYGHRIGIQACDYFRDLIEGKPVNQDSAATYYTLLFRDFISIQNQSGYESLKSKGLELVDNDSLRFDIISLYDFNYEIIEKLEEDYSEMQFNQTYFKSINDIIAPYLAFDTEGTLIRIDSLSGLSEMDKNKLLTYLWRIEYNRNYTLNSYMEVEGLVQQLIEDIELELN